MGAKSSKSKKEKQARKEKQTTIADGKSKNNNEASLQQHQGSSSSMLPTTAGISFRYLQSLGFDPKAPFQAVCNKVKEITEQTGGSFVEHLLKDPELCPHVKPVADYFVSYAWLGTLEHTFGAIETKVMEEQDIFIWMDVFCVDQHKAALGNVDFATWTQVFGSNLKLIGKALIVMVPVINPIGPTRSWCCFEMYVLVSNHIPYDYCVSPLQESEFVQRMLDDFITRNEFSSMFDKINVEKATAFQPYDQSSILLLLREVGVIKVNDIVLNSVKAHLFIMLEKAASKATTVMEKLFVNSTLAELYASIGELHKAIEAYQPAWEFANQEDEETAGALATLRSNNTNPDIVYAGSAQRKVATICFNLGLLYGDLDKFEDAMRMFNKSLALMTMYGDESLHTAKTYRAIAGILLDKMDYPQAEEFTQKALKIQEKISKRESEPQFNITGDNPEQARDDMFSTYVSLGNISRAQRKFEQAEEYYSKAEAMGIASGRALDVGLIYENMGVVHADLGNFDKAMEYYQRALPTLLRVYGEKHQSVALLKANIGVVLAQKGKYIEALEMFEASLAIQLMYVEVDTPTIGNLYLNRAACYEKMGEFEKALVDFLEVRRIRSNIFGPEHQECIIAIDRAAWACLNSSKYTEALALYQELLPIVERLHGSRSTRVAKTLYDLALVYKMQENFEESLSHYDLALAIWTELLGAQDEQVNRVIFQKAHLLVAFKKPLEEIVILLLRVYKVRSLPSSLLDPTEALLIQILQYSAVYLYESDFEKAIPLCEVWIEVDRIRFPPKSVEIADHLFNLGIAYNSTERWGQAVNVLQECADIYNEANLVYIPDVAQVVEFLNSAYAGWCDELLSSDDDAQKVCEGLESWSKIFDRETPDDRAFNRARPLLLLAFYLLKLGDDARFEEVYTRLLENGASSGFDHLRVLSTMLLQGDKRDTSIQLYNTSIKGKSFYGDEELEGTDMIALRDANVLFMFGNFDDGVAVVKNVVKPEVLADLNLCKNLSGLRCDKNHPLHPYLYAGDRWCNVCKEDCDGKLTFMSCPACDYDMCAKCRITI